MEQETLSKPSLEYAEWRLPSYINVTHSPPTLLSETTLESDPEQPNNFARTSKWCGDGSIMMVQCENRSFQLFSSPANAQGLTTSLTHSLTLPQPAAIVDFAWYPGASLHNPSSFCFVVSVRECPVKLLDGKDGRLRASYPIVDHRERQIAPHSLSFNLSANKYVFTFLFDFSLLHSDVLYLCGLGLRGPNDETRLYCGFEDAIEIFDVQRPGQGDRLHTTPSKKSKDGLKGIISTIAFSPYPEYYAAASLTPASSASDNIALFSELGTEPILSIGGVAGLERGGVTQLMFSPTQPHVLFASFRRSERLWAWDVRGDGSQPINCFCPVSGVIPTVNTTTVENGSGHYDNGDVEPQERNLNNQKTRFDIDVGGKWLAVGDQLGNITVYNLESGGAESNEADLGVGRGDVREVGPALHFKAHEADTVGAVAFHPLQPVMLSVSGSRHFDNEEVCMGGVSSGSDSESADSEDDTGCRVRRSKYRPQPSVRDASIKLWGFAGAMGDVSDGV